MSIGGDNSAREEWTQEHPQAMDEAMILASFTLLISFGAERPKYGPQATRLVDAHEYFRHADAPDFWALIPYYLPQRDGKACSLATVTMLINAARAHRHLNASDKILTQDAVLNKISDTAWTRFLNSSGPATTLDDLARIWSAGLKIYGFEKAKVEILRLESPSSKELGRLRTALAQNEKSDRDLMLANFLQSELTGDPEGAVGHVAPIAAFDSKTDRVLVLDPDRDYYEPYWISLPTLARALLTKDPNSGKFRGILWAQGL